MTIEFGRLASPPSPLGKARACFTSRLSERVSSYRMEDRMSDYSAEQVQSFPRHMDYENKGPQVVFEGRKYTAEIEFYVAEDATNEEVSEWLEYEIGGGSISQSHPLYGEQPERVTVDRVRRTDLLRFTEWDAEIEEGRRNGRGNCVFDRPRPASVDTHPEDGDVEQAPLVSGAVPSETSADAQPSVASPKRGPIE